MGKEGLGEGVFWAVIKQPTMLNWQQTECLVFILYHGLGEMILKANIRMCRFSTTTKFHKCQEKPEHVKQIYCISQCPQLKSRNATHQVRDSHLPDNEIITPLLKKDQLN